jgi:hypothetical protein
MNKFLHAIAAAAHARANARAMTYCCALEETD